MQFIFFLYLWPSRSNQSPIVSTVEILVLSQPQAILYCVTSVASRGLRSEAETKAGTTRDFCLTQCLKNTYQK
jgi:hypothetical protein